MKVSHQEQKYRFWLQLFPLTCLCFIPFISILIGSCSSFSFPSSMCRYLCCFSAAQGLDLRSSPAFSWQWGEGWLAMRLAVQPNQWLSEGGGQSGRQHLCAKHAGLGIAEYTHCRFIATCASWSTLDHLLCAFINIRVINYKFQKSILSFRSLTTPVYLAELFVIHKIFWIS